MRTVQVRLACLLVVLTGIASYSNSIHGAFVFDDIDWILRNPTIRSLSPLSSVLLPQLPGATVEGRPLLNLSFALNYAAGGLNPVGFHIVNITIHILAALGLFGIVRRTLELPRFLKSTIRGSIFLPLVCSAIWVAHPLNTESVTYIVQRAESLAGLFYILTLYTAIRGFSAGSSGAWHGLSVAACLLGMASKETLATAPLLVLLYDRLFLSTSFPGAFRSHRKFYLAILSTWLFLGALVVHSGTHGGTVGFGITLSSFDYARLQLMAIVRYLQLSVWPVGLTLDYGIWSVEDTARQAVCACIIGLALLGVIFALRRAHWSAFPGAGFFLSLAPTSSILPITTQIAAEHRMYIPLAFLIVLATAAAYSGISRLALTSSGTAEERTAMRVIGNVAVIGIVVMLVSATRARNTDYSSELAIWRDTVEKAPGNGRAYANYATAVDAAGDFEAASRAFEKAIALYPESAQTWNDYGVAWASRGGFTEAISRFEKAIELRSTFPEAHANLGLAYSKVGENSRALDHFRIALSQNPRSPELRQSLLETLNAAEQ